MIGVFSVFYILFVIILQAPWLIPAQKGTPIVTEVNLSLVSSFAMTTFAYTCHTNIFPIRVELSRPLEMRMRTIFNRAVGLELLMYLSMGIVGYLSMMDNPQQLVTDRLPPASFPKSDPFLLVGRIAMTLNLIIALPVNINPCRTQILILMKKDKEFDQVRHWTITAILVFGSGALAFVYPQVASAFGILGGTCSTMLGITFPIAIYVWTSPDKWTKPLNLTMLTLAVIFTSLGFAGAVVSIAFPQTPKSALLNTLSLG